MLTSITMLKAHKEGGALPASLGHFAFILNRLG